MANNTEDSISRGTSSSKYDVFVSFRGPDTRYKFVGHLRRDLYRTGIKTFVDDRNLRSGEVISPALLKAIEESRISIVVLSEDYASSSWCLVELLHILDCKNTRGQVVIPIFYEVEPSDVRYQKNCYGDAMAAHLKRFSTQEVEAWKSALTQVASISGLHFNGGYESEFIKKIVKQVSLNMPPKPMHVTGYQVGFEPRIEKVKSLLDMKSHDNISMLGIYGIGGVGKTALAKALYNEIRDQFQAGCFLDDVRERSNKGSMESLQKAILSEMLEELETDLGSASRGSYEIKERLRHKKVLLVLDDVDDKKQLKLLAGGCDWFGPGSRIIITTRGKDLLVAHRVQEIYEMTELNDEHSLELFCWNAFEQSYPETGYEGVSALVVSYAKGLPLALEVISSDLRTREKFEDWEEVLEDYKKNQHEDILKVLRVSYNSLEKRVKDVFLDIACFFKGDRIEYVTKILDEFSAKRSIEFLVQRSLLTIENGCLKMHDLIQDMGRQIVISEASNHGECSRLWSFEQIRAVLTNNSGSSKIQGIMLDPPQQKEVKWDGTAFKEMKWLRILIVRNTSFSCGPKHLPNYLRLLDWEEYPSKSLPQDFYPNQIIVFNLCKSHLTLDEPFKAFSCLTSMNFSNSQAITEIPDASYVPNLRELRLDNCKNLVRVHESIGFLKMLAHLSTSECINLKHFLKRMHLPSLEILDLNFCKSLESFPEIVERMDKKLKIYMVNTAIEELPHSICNLIGLDCIEIQSSKKLRRLPNKLPMLTTLDVSDSPKLQNVPECTKLEVLDVHFCSGLKEIKLPSTIKKVDARYCYSLSRETIDTLWHQVSKEIHGLEVVMPEITEIPEGLFHFSSNEGNPVFWARGKFPIIALALVFTDINEMAERSISGRRQLVDLHLDINGLRVPRKGYHTFRVAPDHVLLCDLRVLFRETEWTTLNASFDHEWNLVKVSYEATSNLTLSSWGVFVYNYEIYKDDVQFMCPDPTKYSNIMITSNVVPPVVRDHKQERLKYIDKWALDKMYEGMLKEITLNSALKDSHHTDVLLKNLKDISNQAKAALESNGEGSVLEDKNSTLGWVLDTIMKEGLDKPGVSFHDDISDDESLDLDLDQTTCAANISSPPTDLGVPNTRGIRVVVLWGVLALFLSLLVSSQLLILPFFE